MYVDKQTKITAIVYLQCGRESAIIVAILLCLYKVDALMSCIGVVYNPYHNSLSLSFS